MLAAFTLVVFIIYSTALFFITNWYVLLGLVVIELAIAKINKFLWKNLGFVIIVMLFNLIYANLEMTLLFGIRLFLAVEATYIVSRWFTPAEFAHGFCLLLLPLKLFRVDLKELELMLTIALTFVPILSREASIVKQSLLAKGFAFNFKNVLTRPQVYLVAYINGMFDRIEIVELALRAKGYE